MAARDGQLQPLFARHAREIDRRWAGEDRLADRATRLCQQSTCNINE